MSKTLISTFVFNPSAGTIDFSSTPNFKLSGLLAVINAANGLVLYSPTPLSNYSVRNGSVLTLKVPTIGQNANDPLLVFYDDGGKPAQDASLQSLLTLLGQPLALPIGAATEATLAGVKAAILAQLDLATGIWTDGTNYYVRREILNEGTGVITISFTNPDGTPAAVSASSLKPITADSALALTQTQFDAVLPGTGFAVGDILCRLFVINKSVNPPTASSSVWLNLTQGTTLSAPPPANAIVEPTQHLSVTSTVLATNAATDGTDSTGVVMPAGGAGPRGWLSGIYSRLNNILNVQDAANASYTTGNVLTVGAAAVAPGRALAINASVAGTVTFKTSGGTTFVRPVAATYQEYVYAVTQIISTTATATFENLA